MFVFTLRPYGQVHSGALFPYTRMVETINLAHLPPDLSLYVAFYENVENASHIREQLLAGNQDFNYAFIDATTAISRKHVLAAAFRALNDYINDRLKSNNVHSEIVFCLSPNNNIGEAFRRFGVQDTTKSLIAVKVAIDPTITQQSVSQHLSTAVKGTQTVFDDEHLRSVSDLDRLRKLYKLATKQPARKTANGNTSHALDERLDVERQILGLMALRGAN